MPLFSEHICSNIGMNAIFGGMHFFSPSCLKHKLKKAFVTRGLSFPGPCVCIHLRNVMDCVKPYSLGDKVQWKSTEPCMQKCSGRPIQTNLEYILSPFILANCSFMKPSLAVLKELIIKIELSTARYSPSVRSWITAGVFTNYLTHSLSPAHFRNNVDTSFPGYFHQNILGDNMAFSSVNIWHR